MTLFSRGGNVRLDRLTLAALAGFALVAAALVALHMLGGAA